MTEAHKKALVSEAMAKLDHKAFFERLAALGITATDEHDAVASKKLGEDLAKMYKGNGLETAAHSYSRARDTQMLHQFAGQGFDDKEVKQMVDKLLGEQPELCEVLKTLDENPGSHAPIKPRARKRKAGALRSKRV